MPLLKTYTSPLIGIWEIQETRQELLSLLKNKEIYTSELSEIHNEKRRKEWIAVRLLLEHFTGTRTHIKYHENGKPQLFGNKSHISISHTSGYAAVILSKKQNPGIDIEFKSDRAWKLRRRYMSETEIDGLNTALQISPIPSKLFEMATVCWCAKETAFKALSQSNVDFIKHLHIMTFSLPGRKGSLLLKETKTSKHKMFRVNYRIADDYIITWKG